MDIRLSSGTVIRVFFWLIAILLAGHLIGQVIRIETGHDSVFGLIPLFDFYDEANLPTWTSNILLLASSFMLLLIGLATRAKGGRDTHPVPHRSGQTGETTRIEFEQEEVFVGTLGTRFRF